MKYLLSVIIVLILGIQPILAQNQQLLAGASFSNITPDLGEPLAGGWSSTPTDYVHDQLYAKTLILNDGSTTLVMVIVDNVSLNREVYDAAKAMIENKLGIPKENILMASTHTHSATNADKPGKRNGWSVGEMLEGYQRTVVKRIADGVKVAYANLEPAKIAWGSVDIPDHVFNRRWIMKEPVINPFGEMDKVKMNPGRQNPNALKPAGPVDPEVSFVAVEALSGRPLAVLSNYSLHYVGGVPKGHISADYFGEFGRSMESLLQAHNQFPPFVGMMSNGTSADINNNNYAEKAEKYEPYVKMKMVADDVANKVFREYKKLKFQTHVDLGVQTSELKLEIRRMDEDMKSWMKAVEKKSNKDKPVFHKSEDNFVNRVKMLEAEWPDTIAVVIQALKIGDLGIAAVPFEMFAEAGLEIKEKSPFEDTFTIGLANGGYGYLPTAEQHELGGYETWLTINRVEKTASQKIIDELMRLMQENLDR